MRLPGWCVKCRRVKTVNVDRVGRGTAFGTCDECRDKEQQRTRFRKQR